MEQPVMDLDDLPPAVNEYGSQIRSVPAIIFAMRCDRRLPLPDGPYRNKEAPERLRVDQR
jgi:hypothetical protein